MNEIKFNGLWSYTDLGLLMTSYLAQPPAPNIVKGTSVPYQNGSYDFTSLYGETSYSERTISVSFEIVTQNMAMAQSKYTQLIAWLMTNDKAPLIYSLEPGYYYSAKVESAPSWESLFEDGALTIVFTAYPFKLSVDNVGADVWDNFNFETGYSQITKFNVVGQQSIQLYNGSVHKIVPSIICTQITTVTMNSVTYKLAAGNTKDYRFILEKGFSDINLVTTGTVEFVFKEEVF